MLNATNLRMAFNACIVIFIAYSISMVLTPGTVAETDDRVQVTPNRYFFKSDCLQELNKQINYELHASMVYHQMCAHFDNLNVARKGFARFFCKQSDEEKRHAQVLMDYVNSRGETCAAFDVKMPPKHTWSSAQDALADAISLENKLNDYIHKIHAVAENICQDPHLTNFLEENYITEQVSSIAELTRLQTTLRKMDSDIGEYLVDRSMQGDDKDIP